MYVKEVIATGTPVENVVSATTKSGVAAARPMLPSQTTVVVSLAMIRKYDATPFAEGVAGEITPNVITPTLDTELDPYAGKVIVARTAAAPSSAVFALAGLVVELE